MLVSFENVSFGYGDNLIFSEVRFAVNEGGRVGLIGANGEGKTTLLKLITGELSPDSGKILIKNGARIGYLAQNGGYSSGNTVYGEMREVFAEDLAALEKLDNLSAELAANEGAPGYRLTADKIDRLNNFIAARDSYDIDVRIKTVLNGMGFADFYDRVVDTMSGGEKTRLKLARLLLEQPDLLILDEPTNHLDITTLFWLEEYLSTFKGAVLVVSHDRYFLDKLCAETMELENKKLNTYPGNYTKYKILKAERNARLLKEYEAAEEERARLKDYIDRNIVRATTAKSAQSRVKQLEKLEIPEKPYIPPKPPAFNFEYSFKPYENVLTVKGYCLKTSDKTLVDSVDFSISRGRKIALVGENGTGKTTLLKAIMRGGAGIERGRYVKVALFDQEGLNLNPQNAVLAELWERHLGATQTEIRALLARSGLFSEDMEKRVGDLSGGERAKLALCVLQSEKANFLLLDEPTNHLDLPARESLEKALREFDGTVLFVSHDRYFISAVADGIIEIENGKLNTFDGNYEQYGAEKAAMRDRERAAEEERGRAAASARKTESYRSRKERAEQARINEQRKKLEEEICALEEEEAEINEKLADPKELADYKNVCALTDRLSRIKNLLDVLYSKYAEVI